MFQLRKSTSLWGRELKECWFCHWNQSLCVDLLVRSWIESCIKKERYCLAFVDLLVRSWIERFIDYDYTGMLNVDLLVRSWIERTPALVGSNPTTVDLLVRSWIERYTDKQGVRSEKVSTSLWGRELKDWQLTGQSTGRLTSTSLWGRELKEQFVRSDTQLPQSRPPCEVVNWKELWPEDSMGGMTSTSLWGRELKD